MKTNQIRLFFLTVVGFLFFQFLICLKVAEPYPAIKFPGFGKIAQTSGKVKYTEYELLAYSSTNDYDRILATELFHTIDKNYIPDILNNILIKHNQPESTANQQNYIDFKSFIFFRLQELKNKNYVKLQVRKLEILKDMNVNQSNKKTDLKEKVDIIF